MKKAKKILCVLLVLTLLFTTASASYASGAGVLPDDDSGISEALRKEIDQYDYIIGTNAFSPDYQFTDKEPLMELADVIHDWGSNMIKFTAREDDTLVDRVLEEQDYDYIFMWYRSSGWFKEGYTEEESKTDYDAVYNFTKKLLTTYNGTGKQFFIGHWEGDWYYLDGYNTGKQTVDDSVTQGMIEWLNNRQKAVDDAKRDTPHENVYVWNYVEVNRVCDALDKGYDRVVNRVLPFTNVDYVSYSAYDSMRKSAWKVKRVIDYIYKNLPEKEGIPGPRVFIGEFAQAADSCGYDDAAHCEANLNILAKYLRCDVRFVLYWQMYCNEQKDDGTSKGFWLIDSDGNKTELYKETQQLFEDGKAYVEQYAKENGRVPTNQEYRDFLLQHSILEGSGTGWRAFRATILKAFRWLIDKLRTLLHIPA